MKEMQTQQEDMFDVTETPLKMSQAIVLHSKERV